MSVRSLTADELAKVDELRDKAKRRPVTLADQEAMTRGALLASQVTSLLKLPDDIWIALTLEEHKASGPQWHLSVSVRGKIPPKELLMSIVSRLGLDEPSLAVISDDPRHGKFVKHVMAPARITA